MRRAEGADSQRRRRRRWGRRPQRRGIWRRWGSQWRWGPAPADPRGRL